jgi:hypothetical protein
MGTMRLLGGAFATVLFLASPALADPPPGKGKSKAPGDGGGSGGSKGDAAKAKGPNGGGPDERGGGHGHGSTKHDHGRGGESDGGGDDARLRLRFDDDQARIIRDWFDDDDHLRGLPPGLAKRDRLPPGLEKQLERNGRLPPGLEKKLHPLPDDLAVRLPRLPDGYRRGILGESLIVLDERTSAIIDVIHGIARVGNTF